MPRKNTIIFSKPEEPTFLKAIKAKIGYQEGPSVDTKKTALPTASENDYKDLDDEQPVVVLPKNSKVTEREATEFVKNMAKSNDEDKADADKSVDDKVNNGNLIGRVVFRKPDKLNNDEHISTNFQGTKRNSEDKFSFKSKSVKLDDNRKKVKNSRLLSFGDGEEDE